MVASETKSGPGQLRWGLPEHALVLTLSLALSIAFPVVSNQNQYLAHTKLGPEGDWLVGTIDPYPPFTWLASLLIHTGGLEALRLLTWGANVVVVAALYVLSRAVLPNVDRRASAIALLLCIITLSPLWSYIPKLRAVNIMTGVANQSALSGFAQPSLFGVLILMALPTWVRAVEPTAARPARSEIGLAIALTSIACVVHPTYLIAVAVGLATAFLARIRSVSWVRVGNFVAIGLTVLLPSVTLNPSILSLAGGGDPALQDALRRFAFERIPHHTLISDWPTRDLWVVLVTVLAMVVLVRNGLPTLAAWLGLTLAVVVLAALLVYATQSVRIALMFPWRVSVFLAPVAAVIVTTEFARLVGRRVPVPRVGIAVVAALLGVAGLISTTRQIPVPQRDRAVSMVRESGVSGIGLIPLDAENIRLNAGVPVYVDYKSPPYTGKDLVEWWRRVDRVRAFEQDPESFCNDPWPEIDWILLESDRGMPTCLRNWTLVSPSGEAFLIYQPA